jgi:hypothetical protein
MAVPRVTKTTMRFVANSKPNSVTGGTPEMPFEPPVNVGVSNSASCMISLKTKVTRTK